MEWIRTEGRFHRSVSAGHLRKACQRQKGECTWCGRQVAGKRQTWCSQDCVNAFMALRPSYIRRIVHARDGGRCAVCGVNCDRMYQLMHRLLHLNWRSRDSQWQPAIELLAKHWRDRGFRTKTIFDEYWQADHVLAVCDGGGLHGVDNFRTLCVPCHHKRTSQDNSRRAAAKQSKASRGQPGRPRVVRSRRQSRK